MNVCKRNGKIVPFNSAFIARAVSLAAIAANEQDEKNIKKVTQIATQRAKESLTKKGGDTIEIEALQDIVEDALFEANMLRTMKAYVRYRVAKMKERENGEVEPEGLLTKEFLSKYKHAPNPMEQLGAFVYTRTYARFLPKSGRREFWWETVRRAVEYNCSLAQTSREEAEILYDNVYHMRQFLSGRTLWVGGTPVALQYPMANYNCAFTVIDRFSAYHDLFYLLMVGSGVGVRVLLDDAKKLPKLRTDIEIIHKAYDQRPRNERLEYTGITFDGDTATMEIGDSKEGWAQAINHFFNLLSSSEYKKIRRLVIVYDSIRPRGERLNTFGGTASGHESMLTMLDKICKTIKKAGVRENAVRVSLRPIDLLDIANIIGENVVSGGVRRTSEIGLIDADDTTCIKAKNDLYQQENGRWEINKEIAHRQMSNNSIYYRTKPTREMLHWHLQQMRYSGEPGWINEVAGKKRRPNFNGCNPCFHGDMKILTAGGWRKFVDLAWLDAVSLRDNLGNVVTGRVWLTGEKPTVRVYTNEDKTRFIECTADHRFMLVDGSECKAMKLAGKKIMTFDQSKNAMDSAGVYVYAVEETGKVEKVYDFMMPSTHWGIVEGVIAHNCGEILLDANGLCNLTTVNVMGFVKDGTLDRNALLAAQRLSARAGYRMTTRELELHEWNKVQQHDRLLGCSLTGWQDMVNATGMSREDQIELLAELRKTAHKAAEEIADRLGGNHPLLVTTIKPEGTLSLLPTVSSGVHYSHSAYYIRRVRISASDPLCRVCEDLGYPVLPEVGQDPQNPKTKVIEFPVKAPEGRVKADVSAIEQLENYKMFMQHYVDHNCSITVHVRNDEWDDVEEWVWNNWDDVVALSFLSYDDNFYELMPYEEITEEEYLRRKAAMKPFDPMLLSRYEKAETDLDVGDSECANGVCPIR